MYPQRKASLPLLFPFTWFSQTLSRQPWLLSQAIKASPQSSEESIWPQVSLCSTQQTGESDSLWVTLLFITLINGPGDQGTFLPATEVLIRMGTLKLSISATPFTLLTSFCLFFSLLSRSQSLSCPAMSVWVSALNRMDSLGALKDGYIRGPAGLTPSSATLTFCLSPLKRPSHPLHWLIGHCHREKKTKEPP